jgi:hypothetical protein
MKKKLTSLFSLSLLAAITACSGIEQSSEDYPKTREEIEAERVGKLTGDGIILFGGKRKSAGGTEAINVNSYLWRATLDTVYFMPLLSADPFGGTILTDWYKNDKNTRERFKLNIYIIGAELRSDALRVTVFKQKLDAKGNWQDVPASAEMTQEIEDKILLRAREIKYGSEN